MVIQEVLEGRYAIEREIGRGGMGIVFLAHDLSLDREVAIKVLPPLAALSEVMRERFVREARLTASLSHPNILPVYSFELREDIAFFVTAFIRGASLRERVEDGGPLEPERGLAILRDIAWALEHAHSRGVIHRDVKPGNVLLESETGRTFVADLGIAQGPAESITATGRRLGTLGFASPEQLSGRQSDRRTDIYGLGATAWFVFTGSPPDSALTTSQAAERLRKQRPDLPHSSIELIGRCLSAYAKDRPDSAGNVAEEVTSSIGRRETLPAALQSWLTKGRGFTIPLLIWSLLPFTRNNWPRMFNSWDWPLYVFTVVCVPWIAFALYRLVALGDVTRLGYRIQDIRAALRSWRRARNRQLFRERSPRPRLGRAVRYITFGALTTGIAKATFWNWDVLPHILTPIGFNLTWIGILVGWIWPGWARPERDTLANLRVRFWESRPGAWVVAGIRAAGQRAKADSHVPPERNTEVALAAGIYELLARLEPVIRSRLEGVEHVASALERQASDLRERIIRLEELEASAVPSASSAAVADHSELVADLARRRESLHDRQHCVIRSIERMRIGLVRLVAKQEAYGEGTDALLEAEEYTNLMRFLSEAQEVADCPHFLVAPTPQPRPVGP